MLCGAATRPATKCLFRSWLNSFLVFFFQALLCLVFIYVLYISLCSRGTSTHFSIFFFFNFNTISSTSPFFYLRLPNYSHLFGPFFFLFRYPLPLIVLFCASTTFFPSSCVYNLYAHGITSLLGSLL